MTEILLGVIIALTQIAGYYFYYLSVKNGVRPNTTMWSIWAFGSLLNFFSYAQLSGDWVKDVLPLACSLACIVLYVHMLSRGRFQKLTKSDWAIVSADMIAVIIWFATDSALVANIAFQVGTIISFIPVYKEVYDEEENEKQLPWLVWSSAYFLDIVLVGLRYEKWGDLVYPVVNFGLHFLMWLLVFTHFYISRSKSRKQNLEVEDHLFVSKSTVAGMGLFTTQPVRKGEVAFTLKGTRIKFSPKNKEEAMQLPNIFGIDAGESIDPIFPYDHINHKCEPNLAVAEDGVSFVALKDIGPGEELTFDYSISEYSDWEMECNCGSASCRKVIQSIDKLPKEYFSNYFPHIPKYFQQVYLHNYCVKNK